MRGAAFSPLACACGARFRSYAAEARHRHNFPALCRGARRPVVILISRSSGGAGPASAVEDARGGAAAPQRPAARNEQGAL